MKHEEMVLRTKQAMAESLKKLMKEKPLSKITISDIVKDCNINRKTFYYHFEDIQELLKWMLNQDAIEIVKHFDLITEYEDAIRFVMDFVEKNEYILNCIYDDTGHEEMKRIFYNDFISVIDNLIAEVEDTMGLYLDKHFKDFLTDFYTGALSNLLISWMKDTSIFTREEVVENIALIFKESLPGIIRKKGSQPDTPL